jgi:uncharacterized YccA/Bax inhibitor family protein
MDGQRINRLSTIGILVLSLTALVTVLVGYTQPPQSDEGALAHIFQLAIVALVPMGLFFAFTTNGKRTIGSARLLGLAAGALVLAFGALYYLEHYR